MSELAHPLPPSPRASNSGSGGALFKIHKVGSAKSISFDVQTFCEISTVCFWAHVLVSHSHTALKML